MKPHFKISNPDDVALIASGKRKTSRIDVDLTIWIVKDRVENGAGQLLDYSASGGKIKTKLSLSKNDLIEISTDQRSAYFARAVVMRSHSKLGEHGVRWIEWFDKRVPRGFLTKARV